MYALPVENGRDVLTDAARRTLAGATAVTCDDSKAEPTPRAGGRSRCPGFRVSRMLRLRSFGPFAAGALVAAGFVFVPASPAVAAPTCRGQAATAFLTTPGTLVGTDGPDVLVGSSGNDTILGMGGDDLICGEGGNDVIQGGDGNDTIWAIQPGYTGPPGANQLYGNAGDDLIVGGPGPDTINGGDGNDTVDDLGGNDHDLRRYRRRPSERGQRRRRDPW